MVLISVIETNEYPVSKNQALIDAVFQVPIVEHIPTDQQNISLSHGILFIVRGNCRATSKTRRAPTLCASERAFYTGGVLAIHMVVFHREFRCAVQCPVPT